MPCTISESYLSMEVPYTSNFKKVFLKIKEHRDPFAGSPELPRKECKNPEAAVRGCEGAKPHGRLCRFSGPLSLSSSHPNPAARHGGEQAIRWFWLPALRSPSLQIFPAEAPDMMEKRQTVPAMSCPNA